MNTYSINGLSITALQATGVGDTNAISITTSTDTQGVYDKIKDFLTQYNALINEMTSLYNADSAKGYEPLTDEEKEFLEETAQLMLKYPTIPCNDCKYCMPCPYGLDIPAVLLHYNRCVNEGNVPRNGQDENYAKARRAFLVGYDRSVPKLRQASHCIGCNQCVAHCTQNIDIPKELHRIDQFVEQLKQGTL